MVRIYERELNQYIENFNSENIEIIVNGALNQIVKLELAECTYNTKDGKLKIKDENSYFEIELSFVYLIELTDDFSKLKFYLDNETEVTIAK